MSHGRLAYAAVVWTACSISLNIVNKVCAHAFQGVIYVLAVQLAVSSICFVPYVRIRKGWIAWACTIPVLFLTMLATSILGLQRVSLGTFVVVRNTSPLLTYLFECCAFSAIRKTPLSVTINMASLAGLCVAALMYEHGSVALSSGVGYVVANMFSTAAERTVERYFLTREWMECSKSTLSFLSNAVALVAVAAYLGPTSMYDTWKGWTLRNSNADFAVLFASCTVGIGISYYGILLQSLISATSFSVLSCATKFAVVLWGIALMGDRTDALSLAGIALSFCASLVYACADSVEVLLTRAKGCATARLQTEADEGSAPSASESHADSKMPLLR